MTKSESRNAIDVLLSGPRFDDEIIDAINQGRSETGLVLGIDHVQIAVPENSEKACRDFYIGVLGLAEIARPHEDAGRSFLWLKAGEQQVHLRPDPDFMPQRYAHPGFLVVDVEAFAAHLAGAALEVTRGDAVGPGRFHVRDPFGNRLEFIQSGG